ncbi:MAG: DMT family transporter [Halobacteriovoraceae bacterium]|nr:DMT family transporter [Halobacteriovoraceae bacterium]
MKGILLIISGCFFWALDTLIRYPLAKDILSFKKIVFIEHLLLSIILIPVGIKSFKKFINSKISTLAYFFIIGCLGSALGTLAFTRAFTIINPSLVILLQKFQPLIAISVAHFYLRERIQKEYLFWAMLCLIGGFLISYADLAPLFEFKNLSKNLEGEKILGYGLTFFAVFAWGMSTVFGKKLTLEGFDQKEIMTGRFVFGFLTMLFFLGNFSFIFELSINTWLKLASMTILSGLFGMYLYYKGLRMVSARVCTIAEMFFPLCAIVINWLFLQKSLSPEQVLGGIMLCTGATVIQIKHY